MFQKKAPETQKNINPSAHQQHCRPPIDREYLRAPTLRSLPTLEKTAVGSCWFMKNGSFCAHFLSVHVDFSSALEKFFFSRCLKTDGFEFHNLEIIHYCIRLDKMEDLIGP